MVEGLLIMLCNDAGTVRGVSYCCCNLSYVVLVEFFDGKCVAPRWSVFEKSRGKIPSVFELVYKILETNATKIGLIFDKVDQRQKGLKFRKRNFKRANLMFIGLFLVFGSVFRIIKTGSQSRKLFFMYDLITCFFDIKTQILVKSRIKFMSNINKHGIFKFGFRRRNRGHHYPQQSFTTIVTPIIR